MSKRVKELSKRPLKRVTNYKQVFSGPQGDFVIADLMSEHGIMGPTYRGNVDEMLIKEGERNVVLRILKILNINVQELRERIEAHEKSLAE